MGETGQDDDVQIGAATAWSAEVAGALEAAGDVDYFRVEVAGAGTLTGETTGRTDTVGALEGAAGQALTEADDGGTEPNFRVERLVQAGTYYIKVEGAVEGEGAAALVAAGSPVAAARQRTTCRVFSPDPVEVRGYTRLGGEVVPVTTQPILPAAEAPTRIGTLLNLSPAQAWVHFYCRKAHQPEAETVDPCNVRLQCGQQDGPSVAWDVDVAPETIVSYWPGRTAADGTSDNLAAALVAAGKTEAAARGRTTCQVFSTDPVDVRGYTQLGETVIPVKN